MEIYRSREFPVIFLIGCSLGAAFLQQWILLVTAFGGFLYFQFFKRDR